MTSTNLKEQAATFKSPVFFFTGKQDYNVVPELVQDYYDAIIAPGKKMYWFEKSAHFPHIEESDLFQKIMIEEVLPVIKPDSLVADYK